MPAERMVLIIEDEPLIAFEIELAVADLNVLFRTAARIEQAIELIGNEHFDYAIMDYGFVDGDAEHLARLLIDRDIPFAFCSGNDRAQQVASLLGVQFLAKPFSFDALTSLLTVGLHAEP